MTSRSTADVFDGNKIPVLAQFKDCQFSGAPKLQLSEFCEVKQATVGLAEDGEQRSYTKWKQREIGIQQGKSEEKNGQLQKEKDFNSK